MNICFLGTGAADWGLNDTDSNGLHRFFCSALIDGVLLIDPGPHIFLSAEKYGIDLSGVRYIINTHPHRDHYSPESVESLCNMGAELISFEEAEEKQVGEYLISSYKANHATSEKAVHFIIESGGKKLFYGLDGAWLLYNEITAIKKKKIDMAVLDATIGYISGEYRIYEHNNLFMVDEIKKSLEDYVKRFVISHMAYTLHTDHKTLESRMSKSNIEVAFDGWQIEI